MLIRAALSLALAVTGAVGAGPAIHAAAAAAPAASSWAIGPIIRGRNYSVGMPLRPTALRGGAFQIELPRAPGSAHYVTFPHGSLAGKSRIVMRYRVETARGVRIAPPSAPDTNGIITLYFVSLVGLDACAREVHAKAAGDRRLPDRFRCPIRWTTRPSLCCRCCPR